jgi:cytidyltransferase-like protein
MKSFLDTIKEEQQGEKHHVITFGRMSPPTAGHLKLIDKVKEVAKKNNATHTIVVSHTQDSKKNPLTAQQKIKHLKRYVAGPITEAKKSDSTNFVANTMVWKPVMVNIILKRLLFILQDTVIQTQRVQKACLLQR